MEVTKSNIANKKNTWVGVTAFSAFLMLIIFTVSLFLSGNEPNSYTIDNEGQKIGGIFMRYKNRVYAGVPSNGDYLIKEADANSFRLIDDSYKNRQFGYCFIWFREN